LWIQNITFVNGKIIKIERAKYITNQVITQACLRPVIIGCDLMLE